MSAEALRAVPRISVRHARAAGDPTTSPLVTLDETAAVIDTIAQAGRGRRARLVAISGVDGSGKSHLTAGLAETLERRGLRVATIGVDPWQRPRAVRCGGLVPAATFYSQAVRWDELFADLVDPLVTTRSIDRIFDVRRTDNDLNYPKIYRFENVDVVLLEGIFLFRRELQARYDLRVWVDCGFGAALRRALSRNQDLLDPIALEREYREICFPAQRLHFARDLPRGHSDLRIDNRHADTETLS